MSLPVIIVCLICWVFCICFDGNKQSRKIHTLSIAAIIIIGIILVIIASLRSSKMADYMHYHNLFYFNGDFNSTRIESGFIFLLNICKKLITSDFIYFLSIVATISIFSKIIAICKITNLWWGAMAIFISSRFILLDMIQIRAAIAAGFFLISMYYAIQRNLKWFIIFTILAITFHWTAIITVAFWFVDNKRLNKPFYLLLIPFSYIFAIIGISITHWFGFIPIDAIQHLYSGYSKSITYGSTKNFNLFDILYLGRSFVCIFLLIFCNVIQQRNKYFILFIKIYTIAICSYCLLWSLPVAAYRISEFLLISEIIAIPSFITLFHRSPFVGKIIVFIISGCYLYSNIVLTKLLI